MAVSHLFEGGGEHRDEEALEDVITGVEGDVEDQMCEKDREEAVLECLRSRPEIPATLPPSTLTTSTARFFAPLHRQICTRLHRQRCATVEDEITPIN